MQSQGEIVGQSFEEHGDPIQQAIHWLDITND